jgi:ribonuclease BN (tRNA processing enzyme)
MSKITFVGTGSAFNHKHKNTSALLEFNGTNLLLDCGYDVPNQLSKIIDLKDLDNIWISHLHGDHINGLEEIGFKNKYLYNKKTNLIVSENIVDGLIQYLSHTMKPDGEQYDLYEYFNIYEINKSFKISNKKFIQYPTKHINNKPSYMIRSNNFIYTADTRFIDWKQYNIDDIDYIFHDVQLLDDTSDDYNDFVHAPLPLILELPNNIKQKIYLMHYQKNVNNFKEILFNNNIKTIKPFDKITFKED